MKQVHGSDEMITEPFLKPRLIGARFSDHAIPLEFLKDLSVLEEMIIEVAKWEYRKENPDRKRIPKGFTEGISLKLTSIDNGSVIPVIALCITANTLFPNGNELYYEKSRDAIISAIGAAASNQSIIEYLPEDYLGYFDRIGRSLREDEEIEFTTPSLQTNIRLTKETRRNLVLSSSQTKEFTEETSIRGLISEVDQDDMIFEIKTYDGRKIKAPMSKHHRETILESLKNYPKGDRVLIYGVGRFSRQQKLVSFESIEQIIPLDPLDVPARLDEFRNLKDGWLDGNGVAPSHDGLDWLSRVFETYYPDELLLPYLYPTEEGGIQAEWSLAPFDISLEINLQTHGAHWHCLNLKTNDAVEKSLDLDNPEEWKWLLNEIQHRAGEAA